MFHFIIIRWLGLEQLVIIAFYDSFSKKIAEWISSDEGYNNGLVCVWCYVVYTRGSEQYKNPSGKYGEITCRLYQF